MCRTVKQLTGVPTASKILPATLPSFTSLLVYYGTSKVEFTLLVKYYES